MSEYVLESAQGSEMWETLLGKSDKMNHDESSFNFMEESYRRWETGRKSILDNSTFQGDEANDSHFSTPNPSVEKTK